MGIMGLTSRLVLAAAGVAGAMALAAAGQPSVLAAVQPGLWEIRGAPGARGPLRQCVTDIASLARFEHRANKCSMKVLKDGGGSIEIDYNCPGVGFGQGQIDVLTPRSLRISTQGISNGLPFNYVLQARRVDECTINPLAARH
jgi:hypothetical protein